VSDEQQSSYFLPWAYRQAFAGLKKYTLPGLRIIAEGLVVVIVWLVPMLVLFRYTNPNNDGWAIAAFIVWCLVGFAGFCTFVYWLIEERG
jgi:hypothetical protein